MPGHYESYPLYVFVIGDQKAILHHGNAKTPEEAMEQLSDIVEDVPVVHMVLEIKDFKMYKFTEADDRTYCPACGKIDSGDNKCDCTR